MNLRRQIAVGCAVIVSVMARPVRAQRTQAVDPHRWAVGLAVDVGQVPDALSLECGGTSDAVPSIGGGVAFLFRARQWLVVEADTRVNAIPSGIGCGERAPVPTPVGPNEAVGAVTRDWHRVPTPPLLRSAMRVGVETPPGLPLVRATVGSGLFWANTLTPFETAAMGIGTRGRWARLYAELETNISRVRVNDVRPVFQRDSTGLWSRRPILGRRRCCIRGGRC